MLYVSDQALQHKKTDILTFDQPLYWKAYEIKAKKQANSDLKKMVLRLGGFHMCLRFLGSIGHIIFGSSLQETFELIFAKNAVPHILSGKAVSRASRAHMLLETALFTLIQSKSVDTSQEEQPSQRLTTVSDETDLSDMSFLTSQSFRVTVQELYDQFLSGEKSVEMMCNDEEVKRLCRKFENVVQILMANGRTAKLWGKYLEMISIFKTFLKAERTGNWELHLKCVRNMLPYFAASGHNLYTKSSYVYLTDMQSLANTHPDVHVQFVNGHHVMRRSDRHWAGLFTDLIIEQVLMRSVKSSGELTRGRGLSENQRSQWLLSMPACAEVTNVINEFTGVAYTTSEQHKEAGNFRMERDKKDIVSMLRFVKERYPFGEFPSLRNIETRVTADSKVNVDSAKEVGERIIESMSGQSISTYSFKRSQQVVTLNSKNFMKIDEEPIFIDPQLLFQRFATLAYSLDLDLSAVLTF